MKKTLYFLILISISSCITKKELVYLQHENLKEQVAAKLPHSYPPYKLQSNDVLSVSVQNDQPELSNIFNIVDPSSGFGLANPGTMFLSGYVINEKGIINLPIVGELKVAGLTTAETQELIQQNVVKYIKDATVIVKLISFKISVLGEVRNPGYYYIYHERVTLLEALAQAGDISRTGNRENIKLVRQTPAGSEIVLLDLTDPKLVQSPYYHLMPNDALYVEPSNAGVNRENLVLLNTMFGAISAAVLLLNYFR